MHSIDMETGKRTFALALAMLRRVYGDPVLARRQMIMMRCQLTSMACTVAPRTFGLRWAQCLASMKYSWIR